MNISTILMWALIIAGIVLLIKILTKPIRFIFKLLINAGIGFVILFFVNFFGSTIGIALPITWITALVTGFLGVPGVILLLLLQIL